jgi:asparagine synthase (glutamine-hydrolysing)
MMMAHAVEGRFPFLDPRVAEAAFRLDTAAKLSPDDAKIALKRAFGEKLPGSITARPKQPYRAPDAAAFFAGGTAPEWFRELTRPEAVKAAGILRPRMVSRLIEKCQAADGSAMSRSDNQRLVAVVSTMLLQDQFIAHNPGKLGEGAHSNIRILTPRSVHAGA